MGTRMDHLPLEIPETRPEKILKKMALVLCSVLFFLTGLRHMLVPDFYMLIMPKNIPIPLFLIYFTGILQMVCAIGLLFLKTRRWAAYGLMVFLLATLPLLIYMWVYKDPIPTGEVPSWLKLISIPLQFALFFWVYLFAKKPESY